MSSSARVLHGVILLLLGLRVLPVFGLLSRVSESVMRLDLEDEVQILLQKQLDALEQQRVELNKDL